MIENLNAVNTELAEAMHRTERKLDTVNLVAVSKTKPAEEITPVLDAGHRVFGENRVQECRDKWVTLKEKYDGVQLHLIGQLQTNKVKYLPHLVDVIETVDRMELVEKIIDVKSKNPEWAVQCFVQINTGDEEQKAGVAVKEADAFIQQCHNAGLSVDGLMCIPPVQDNPALHFALLRKIAHRNNVKNLSMGMSADYKVAIEFDATHIRVGTAIFGGR